MSSRHRTLAFLVIVGLLTAATAAFLVVSSARQSLPPKAARSGLSVAEVTSQPHVVFRSTDMGSSYGLVAVVPLDDPEGPRAFTDLACDRVDAAGPRVVCARTKRGVVTRFEAELLDETWSRQDSWPLAGQPSRTRLSPDARLVATTVFVTGHSYAGAGTSTATEVREVDGRSFGNLEDFELVVDGRRLRARDTNIWGVTFAEDGRTFYATAASAGRTWLVRGDLEDRRLTALRENAECPSLAPGGHEIAYKKRVEDSPSPWVVAVLDLRTGEERVLDRTRGLDDQVEWLDDETLLYGLPREDQPGVSDVWSVAADGDRAPRLFIPMAWSPAVVR